MAFALDREEKSDDAVKSLERKKRKLRFLPRRCLENYCLHSAAIANVLNDLGESDVDTGQVEAVLYDKATAEGYRAKSKWKNDISDSLWLQHVDAPRLLRDVFQELSGNRHEYRKTRDTLSILRSIEDIDADWNRELKDYLKLILETVKRDTPP